MILFLLLLLAVPSAWAEWTVEKACPQGETCKLNENVIEGATSCANYMTAPGGGCLKPPAKSTLPLQYMLWDQEASQPIVTVYNYEECRTGHVKCLIYLDPILGIQVTRDKTTVTDCLAKMEAAMKAMEPWVVVVKDGTISVPDLSIAQLAASESIYKAAKLWEQTKCDCWRQP